MFFFVWANVKTEGETSDNVSGFLEGAIEEGTEPPPFTAPKDTCQQHEIDSSPSA
jgi:hypothetical protein